MSNDYKKFLDDEINTLVSGCSFAEKETGIRINNIKTFKDIVDSDLDRASKAKREEFDKEIRNRQMKLEEGKLEWEKSKFDKQQEFDRDKIDKNHEEKMAELENDRLKYENEAKRIENESKRMEDEFAQREMEYKKQRRRDWLQFGIRLGVGLGLTVTSFFLHASEIRLEQKYNGIVSKRCGTYDKVIEGVTSSIIK